MEQQKSKLTGQKIMRENKAKDSYIAGEFFCHLTQRREICKYAELKNTILRKVKL